MNDALEKINSQIQFALSYLIREEYPDEIISITDVQTTPDLELSSILVSILNDDHHFIQKLNRDAKSLRMELAKSQNLRHTPELKFEIDESDSKFEKIDKLLKQDS